MAANTPSAASPTSPPSGSGGSPAPDIYQSGPSSSNQFIRKFSLTLLGAGGQSWTLSDSSASGALSGGTSTVDDPLRITFSVRCARLTSRQSFVCKVYNLSRQHPAAALGALYNRVVLRAGYVTGNFGTIFDGSIIQMRQGREPTLTETYLEITAQGGDFAANLTTAALAFNAGSTANAVVTSVANLMAGVGATLGDVLGLSTTPFIRGRAHYGMAIDVLRKYGLVYMQNGVVNVIGPNQAAPASGGAVTVNANTGLIGMAEINGPNGVEFKVNLNPTLGIGSVVTLNNADLNVIAAGNNSANGLQGTQGPGNKQFGYYVDPSADGTYLVVLIEHVGDSRGNEWETRVTAWPHGALATPTTDETVMANTGRGPTPGQVQTNVAPPNLPPDNDAGGF